MALTKREPRREVLVPGRMRTDSGWVDVKIRNLSQHGLMFRTDAPPRAGSVIEIRRHGIVIIGRAMWRDGACCGVRAQDPLDIDAIVATTAPGAAPRRDGGAIPSERRRDPAREVVVIAERSRSISSWMQFGILACGVATAATFGAIAVHDTLAPVAARVGAALG